MMVTASGTVGGGRVVGGDAASQVKLSGRSESHSGRREEIACRPTGGESGQRGAKLKPSCFSSCASNELRCDGRGCGKTECMRVEKSHNAVELPLINKFITPATNTDQVASVGESLSWQDFVNTFVLNLLGAKIRKKVTYKHLMCVFFCFFFN